MSRFPRETTTQVGRYKFDSSGVCENPDVILKHEGNIYQYTLQVCEGPVGWLSGYYLTIRGSSVGCGQRSSPPSKKGTIYFNKDHASLEAANIAMEYFGNKKHRELNMLRAFIEHLKPPTENIEPAQPMRYSDEDLENFELIINKRIELAKKELNYLQGLIDKNDPAIGPMDQLETMKARQGSYIGKLKAAVSRIKDKTFGICMATGKLIDKAKLSSYPTATTTSLNDAFANKSIQLNIPAAEQETSINKNLLRRQELSPLNILKNFYHQTIIKK